MPQPKYALAMGCAVLGLLAQVVAVQAVRISPAVASIRSIPIPSNGAAGFALTITNTDVKDKITFHLEVQSPAGIFESKVPGYGPIPNVDFVTLPMTDVTLMPNDSAIIPFGFNIPDDPKYFNQSWLCIIGVTEREHNRQSFAQYTGGAVVQLFLETASNATVATSAGNPGVKPLWSTHDNVVATDVVEAPFTVFNNDSLPHSYRPYLYVRRDHTGHSTDSKLADIDTIPGYIRYDRADLVTFTPETFSIHHGKSADVVAHIKVPPEYAQFGWNSEAILMVADEQNHSAFVRCFMDLKK